jgi:hypothetical protein
MYNLFFHLFTTHSHALNFPSCLLLNPQSFRESSPFNAVARGRHGPSPHIPTLVVPKQDSIQDANRNATVDPDPILIPLSCSFHPDCTFTSLTHLP